MGDRWHSPRAAGGFPEAWIQSPSRCSAGFVRNAIWNASSMATCAASYIYVYVYCGWVFDDGSCCWGYGCWGYGCWGYGCWGDGCSLGYGCWSKKDAHEGECRC